MRTRNERVNGPYRHGSKWRVAIVGADGRRTYQAFEIEAEAVDVAEAARAQIEGRTVSKALDAYEVSLRERELAGVTIARTRAHLDALLAAGGGRPLSWLTPRRAADLYTRYRSTETRYGRAPSVDTHRNALAAARAFGRWCVDRGWLLVEPFAAVKPIGRRRRGKPQLTLDETRRLIDACLAERSRESLAVATALLLGLSASETTERQVRDLDDGGRALVVRRGKNRYRERRLEVPDGLREALLELAAGRAPTALLYSQRPGAPVRQRGHASRPSRHWLYWHCRRLCREAGAPEVTPHGLRGTHATLAVGAVATSQHVAAALVAAGASLGHAPGSPLTASTYAAPGAVDAARAQVVLRSIKGGLGS